MSFTHPEIEKLIKMALADGQVTDKEREIILRKAEKLGLDIDEVEMYLEGYIGITINSTEKILDINGNIDEVTIGNQVWMTKNLNVDKFRNGDPITFAKYESDWIDAFKNKKPVWGYYDNNPNMESKYGKIYNWYAVNDKRGLAPHGWKIPNSQDWEILINYLGGIDCAGEKMKSNSENWNNFGFGNNSSGFLAEPGGQLTVFKQSFDIPSRMAGTMVVQFETEGHWASFFSSEVGKMQVTDLLTGKKLNGKFKDVFTSYHILSNGRTIYSKPYSSCDGCFVYVRCLKNNK